MIRIMASTESNLEQILHHKLTDREEIAAQVAAVLADIKERGDEAVCAYTARFDGATLVPGQLLVSRSEIDQAYAAVDPEVLQSLRVARERIEKYHRLQLTHSWLEPDQDGVILGQLVRPVGRVGLYVPGGTASYPSSVLMNAVPARVAGVPEIVMATPPDREGRINPYTLVAAVEAGVQEIYKAGGTQAIGALAYGTATVAKVDKITGPGNIYVTLAKQQVYGLVDIDMLAGPSEVLVVADHTANPVHVAADLLSQAEHDVLASAVLLTPDRQLAEAVGREIERQLAQLPRREVAARSLDNYGAIVITRDLTEAIALANRYAPEHLELVVAEPFQWLGRIQHAGAIFLGPNSPEPVGDYLAGPNHVLPTGGTARFYSPLGVETFLKRSSVISFSREALHRLGPDIVRLAGVEGLTAHANAIKVRLTNQGGDGNGR